MDQSQYETPVQVISHRYGVLWELEFVTVNPLTRTITPV